MEGIQLFNDGENVVTHTAISGLSLFRNLH